MSVQKAENVTISVGAPNTITFSTGRTSFLLVEILQADSGNVLVPMPYVLATPMLGPSDGPPIPIRPGGPRYLRFGEPVDSVKLALSGQGTVIADVWYGDDDGDDVEIDVEPVYSPGRFLGPLPAGYALVGQHRRGVGGSPTIIPRGGSAEPPIVQSCSIDGSMWAGRGLRFFGIANLIAGATSFGPFDCDGCESLEMTIVTGASGRNVSVIRYSEPGGQGNQLDGVSPNNYVALAGAAANTTTRYAFGDRLGAAGAIPQGPGLVALNQYDLMIPASASFFFTAGIAGDFVQVLGR